MNKLYTQLLVRTGALSLVLIGQVMCMDTVPSVSQQAARLPKVSYLSALSHYVTQSTAYKFVSEHATPIYYSLLAAKGMHDIVSTEQLIEQFSDGKVSADTKITIRALLHTYKVPQHTSWKIKKINTTGLATSHIPYALVTSSVIFIDEDGLNGLKKYPKEYAALCAYIAHQALTYSYIKTEGAHSLAHGTTGLVVYGVVRGMTSAAQSGLQAINVDHAIQSVTAYMPWFLASLATIYVSTQFYYKVQSYVEPYIKMPFEKYIQMSLCKLDKKVVETLGDQAEGARELLCILRDSLDNGDSRYESIKERIKML